MKRLLLMMLLSASVVGAWAQEDYHPFVKEGKVWNCTYSLQQGKGINCSYTISGDTTILGIGYKKLLCQDQGVYHDDAQHYFAALREEGRQVFMVNEGMQQEYMLYDFEPDKEVTLRYEWRGLEASRSVGKFGEIKGTGHYLFFVSHLYIETNETISRLFLWLDGIGYLRGPFTFGYQGRGLVSCYEDGELIYEKNDEIGIMRPIETSVYAIEDSPKQFSADSTLFDLQGRRLTQQPQRGLYIQQGRKVMVR